MPSELLAFTGKHVAGPDGNTLPGLCRIASAYAIYLISCQGKGRRAAAQMEYDLGGFNQVTALEERRRDALPDLPPSDLLNVALQKYRSGTCRLSLLTMPC